LNKSLWKKTPFALAVEKKHFAECFGEDLIDKINKILYKKFINRINIIA
jgi:hypothetical protein